MAINKFVFLLHGIFRQNIILEASLDAGRQTNSRGLEAMLKFGTLN